MKKLNKLVAILVAMAMVLALTVISAFAVEPEPNTTDFAVTKELKVPAGTTLPDDSSVKVKIDLVSYNSVEATEAQNTAYDYETTFDLNEDADHNKTEGATTYYYYTTGNMLETLGLNTAPAGVYKFEISENDYKINNTAYGALESPEHATIENGGTFDLTVAKTVNDTYSITASQNDTKVEVKEVKTGEDHNASIEDNGVKLVNTYYTEGSGDTFETSTFKVTKDVLNDNGLYNGEAFTMDLTIVLPDIDGVEAEGYIKYADTTKADSQVTVTGTKAFALADDDIFYLTKAPEGTLVTVAENDDRAGTAADNKMYIIGGDTIEAIRVTDEAQTKTITNTYNESTTEGILHNSIPFIVLALVAVGGMVAYIVVRRKSEDNA